MSGFLTLRRGDTFVAQAAFSEGGIPQDMTDWEVEATLQYAACGPVVLDVDWGDQVGGIAVVTLGHEETQGLQIGDHVLRVRAINPQGHRTSCNPVMVKVSD